MKRTASQIGRLSRRKGKAFERVVAHKFSELTGRKWETTRNSGRTDLLGDIYCPDFQGEQPLVVECKHDKNYSVHGMLTPTKVFVDMVAGVLARCQNKHYIPDWKCQQIRETVKIAIVIKNETGIWMWTNMHARWTLSTNYMTIILPTTIFMGIIMRFFKLEGLSRAKEGYLEFNSSKELGVTGRKG